ncbi:dihydroorotase [Magnetococcus marinus MC-1]|uniref:Dihydroorotase n=1 Tax=Magnetococcus marinus (strain ATCC BAA-1437 / JCM 17883 / MC-1) TaxID=156889 RepID=A0L3T8_MAGMM|nr:dihydroorotase [Magnetococcus marinus]ABK42631.1 dihydroorotase [Magnetococcus marinus MC-1]
MMRTESLFIRGARVVDPANERDEIADILIVDGVIREIGKLDAPAHVPVIEADGLIAAPGLVDMHVHLREPGYEYKETIAGGTRAAAAGGVTSVAAMPNTKPVNDDPSVTGYMLDKARVAGFANLFPIGAVSKGLQGKEITEMGLLQAAGCVAFSDDGLPIMNSGLMRRALDYSRAFGGLIIQHAEDSGLVGCGCMNEGEVATRLGLSGICNAAEDILVERDIRLVELTGGRYHVAHISSAGAVASVAKAREKGLRVSCEAAPHHLVLNDTHVGNYDTNAKMAPPLRNQRDVNAIQEALARGVISVIATDHAPHEEDSKRVPFCQAANGVVGLETLLPITLELVEAGVLPLAKALAAISCNPARLLGMPRGTLSLNAVGDVVLFDPQQSWTVDALALHGSSKNTAFAGRQVKGRVKYTILAGRIVHQEA